MSTSYTWEGKGRYGSFRLRMNVWVCRFKSVKSLENTCHTWSLLPWWFTTKRRYRQVYAPLPLTATTPRGTVSHSCIVTEKQAFVYCTSANCSIIPRIPAGCCNTGPDGVTWCYPTPHTPAHYISNSATIVRFAPTNPPVELPKQYCIANVQTFMFHTAIKNTSLHCT